jgi:branched-chain amino acid transport system permease protein
MTATDAHPVDTTTTTLSDAPALPSMWSRITVTRVIAVSILLVIALFLIPAVLNSFWLQIMITAVIYTAVTLGLNLLVGRPGLYSLCQIPLVALGAWFAIRVTQEMALPFPVLLVVSGLLTSVVGVIIGLPAIRLSGLYLALITLMAAGAITMLLGVVKYPNGGGGIWGYDKNIPSGIVSLDRPSIADSDLGYYRYCVVVVAILFLLVTWHIAGKPGRAWAAIRQSEVTAISAGVNTTFYKLWAFALSAFVTGVAGALVAAGPGGVGAGQFPIHGSILLLAVVLMGGIYSIWGAIVAAFLLRILPRLLDQLLGLPAEALTVLFGVGIIQVLLTAPGGIISDLERLVRGIGAKLRPGRPVDEEGAP